MQPDQNVPSANDKRPGESAPPPLPATELRSIGTPLPLSAGFPTLPPKPTGPPGFGRQFFAILLSLCLGLFLAEGVVSLADDSLILFFNSHVLAILRGILFLLAMLMAIVIYGLMGLTPMIPKRLFLPVTLFHPVAGLLVIPLMIYFFGRVQQIVWVISLCQVLVGLIVLYWVRGGFKWGWPLVAESWLGGRGFSWRNLCGFLLVNALLALPAVIVYLVVCAALAVDHFSEGFLALRPGGLTVEVRKYVRKDGKTIQLFPMSHIGEPEFYRKLSQSFPSNSIILMEGVTDNRNLLTNKITYTRMATSLGLAEQHEEFKPSQGEVVPADVDVEVFGANTIDFLNLIMLIHSKGMNSDVVMRLMQYSPPPHFEVQLFDDLLRKRNRHLLEEIESRLSQSEHLIVPWGVAHMPEIAKAIQKSGFRLNETQEYVAIRFGSGGNTKR
jgi:hypothetical protein